MKTAIVVSRCPAGTVTSLLPCADKATCEAVAFVALQLKEHGGSLAMIHESCALYTEASLKAPRHGSLLLNLMHTLEVRADLFAALVHGVRFCETHGKGLGAIARAVRGVQDKGDIPIVKRADFESDSAFYDALAILFTLVKVLFLMYPS